MKKPGPTGFEVESAGGLPSFICETARAIKRSGKTTSEAIAIAVSRIKVWAATSKDAKVKAKSMKAIAEWEALRLRSKSKSMVKASNTSDPLAMLAAELETILPPPESYADKFVRLSVLTTRGRKRLKSSDFAIPPDRYPIHDLAHARNALARVAQHGTPEEQAKVRAAVYRRYPQLKPKAGASK